MLLALLLNAWRENLANDRKLEKVKKTIVKEIRQNDLEVRKSFAFRTKLIADLLGKMHKVNAIPLQILQFDITNDQALEDFIRQQITFSSPEYYKEVALKRSGDQRVLILDEHVYQLRIEQDTLNVYGTGNMTLKTAGVSNRFWDIAQVSGTLVNMDLELVDAIIRAHNLNLNYLATADDAIEMIYKSEPGIISVLQDMAYYEHEIIRADSVLLRLLEE